MQAQGGEDMLLDEFEGLGLHCEAGTQLVVLCEVCQRPATKECWTCGMKICDFCTLKRHWKVRCIPRLLEVEPGIQDVWRTTAHVLDADSSCGCAVLSPLQDLTLEQSNGASEKREGMQR